MSLSQISLSVPTYPFMIRGEIIFVLPPFLPAFHKNLKSAFGTFL